MKKVFLVACCWVLVTGLSAQTITEKLQNAFQKFESDSQMKHAISSLYVIDAATGQVVFDKNSQVGLAGASTQKIITAATAFELLGKDYRYKTSINFIGGVVGETLNGGIIVLGSGDPSFGSWRWQNTSEEKIIEKFAREIVGLGIKKIEYGLRVSGEVEWGQEIPDGWIIQDIGNYYGAGSSHLNWRENQFDVYLKSGDKIGDLVKIVGYKPRLYFGPYSSEVKSAAKGSGDNAYIYQNPYIIRGTIPINENKFQISGSMKYPSWEFLSTLEDELVNKGIIIGKDDPTKTNMFFHLGMHLMYTHYSPSLDSLIYWFLKKSINLYGEALVKTFAYNFDSTVNRFGSIERVASTNNGISIVKKFWKDKGLDEDELNIYDGSGLSPLNRITTHAQVEVLKYANTKDWFPYFYDALPEYNGMKMKSGTISDVKGFCGYQKSKDGKEYIFSFLVNNYNGKTSGVVNKMYKVLDELK